MKLLVGLLFCLLGLEVDGRKEKLIVDVVFLFVVSSSGVLFLLLELLI